jgi:hypothetical protein
MDVDVCVDDIRNMIKKVRSEIGPLADLAAKVEALFEWLDKGGHLPTCWGE